MKEKPFDIIVIGAGGAGFRAALAAHDANPNLRIALVSHGEPGDDGITGTSVSDRMAFHASIDDGDDWREHAKDIFEGGMFVSDPNLANILARGAEDAFEYLKSISVPWVLEEDGKPSRFRTDGSKVPRALYTGHFTAIHIYQKLHEKASSTPIEFFKDHQLADLKRADGSKYRWEVTLREKESENLDRLECSAVILATGGPGGLFGSILFQPKSDALPYFCALKNGAGLVNLEFIQYGIVSTKTGLACSGTIPRALPRVVDENGVEILEESQLELLFRKGASWPVSAESETLQIDEVLWKVTSEEGVLFLDFTQNPSGLDEERYQKIVADTWDGEKPPEYAPTPLERLAKANPSLPKWLLSKGVDLSSAKLKIKHEVQHFQGGILIDETASTGVPGLFACGECAGGQHGANRPGGNSLMDCQVMGKIAGESAMKFVDDLKGEEYSAMSNGEEIEYASTGEDGLKPSVANVLITEILRGRVGMIRNGEHLSNALDEMEYMISRGLKKGSGSFETLVMSAGIVIAKLFIESVLMRKESRGSHLLKNDERDELCPRDKNWDRQWIISRMSEDGTIETRKTAIPELKK